MLTNFRADMSTYEIRYGRNAQSKREKAQCMLGTFFLRASCATCPNKMSANFYSFICAQIRKVFSDAIQLCILTMEYDLINF